MKYALLSRFNRGPRERDLEGDDRSMGRSTRFTDPAQGNYTYTYHHILSKSSGL